MTNEIFSKIQNKIKLEVSGKNLDRFIKKLISKNIEILNIEYKKNKIIILIKKDDYKKVKQIKSIYEINIVDYQGLIKFKKIVNKSKHIILLTILGLILLYLLSNTIFKVRVIHNDVNLRNTLLFELENYQIKKGKRKKSYQEIQTIKTKILEKYQNKIEWLEIEELGTTYIVRVQERIINHEKNNSSLKNVVSKKVAIIKKITAEKGDIVKNINDYVNPGDIIISGEIKLNDETKDYVGAKGSVFGEVWYTTTITYPLAYSEKKETGKEKNVFVLKILNKEFELTLKKFKNKKIKELVILKNNFVPISLTKQKQKEIKRKEYVATIEEAINASVKLGRKKLNDKLKTDEHIINEKQLKLKIKNSKIELEMFYSVYENITDYQTIVRSDDHA